MGVQSYDIIIVGGGTAGSFAAATAARDGYSVAVLERKTAKEAGKQILGKKDPKVILWKKKISMRRVMMVVVVKT